MSKACIASIVSGIKQTISIQLYKVINKVDTTFLINPTATVTASIIDSSEVKYTSDISVLSSTPGSAWATSLIVPIFPSSETSKITKKGLYIIQIVIIDGDIEEAFYAEVNVIKKI